MSGSINMHKKTEKRNAFDSS